MSSNGSSTTTTSTTTEQMLKLTSTTAPGKVFHSRYDLAQHYKSDWHKYNLKRREMNMAMLTFDAFTARLEAALALREERERREERSGKDHLKDKKKSKKGKDDKKKGGNGGGRKLSKRQMRQQEKRGVITNVINDDSGNDDDDDIQSNHDHPENDDTIVTNNNDNDDKEQQAEEQTEEEEEEEQPPVIDPKQSLFNNKTFPTVQQNIDYMYKQFGFFIPDVEYLVDPTGTSLVGYCAEKIKLGHTCLYCQKVFKTWRACQEHMVDKRHCKIRYERGIDLEEFDVFYDFREDDEEFLRSGIGNYKKKKKKNKKKTDEEKEDVVDGVSEQLDSMNVDDNGDDDGDGDDDDDDDDSGEWEDIDSDEDEEMYDNDEDDDDDDDGGLYEAYQDEIAQHGLDITPLGELIFPDGRIIGHRGLSRYYKQRITLEDSRAAVVAQRRANGERLFGGRVYDTYGAGTGAGVGAGGDGTGTGSGARTAGALELAKAGLSIGATRGRQGRGILVSANGATATGSASYTALSLYRYRAAVKKSRREEFKGRKLQQRWTLPMNKMDKKWNRLHNNVSVAHAPR